MGKADLHAHTCHDAWGDGNQTVEELFRYVEEQTDLDVFAITDHDSTEAAREGLDLHARGTYRFDFLPGVEVTNQAGHLLCYFPGGEIHDIPSLRPFWSTVQYAHDRAAICVVAHPIYPPWLVRTLERGLAGGNQLEGIEAVNAGLSEKASDRLGKLSERFAGSVALTGNSDAHDQSAVGAAYTQFPGENLNDFLVALSEARTKPIFVRKPEVAKAARAFTTRRSMMRPGWVRNIWREVRPVSRPR